MEYLQGRELSKVLVQGHRFQPDEVASIIWKLADALEHAHQNGVVHRDVKPANIFMLKDDQPKLVDFGIARAPNRVPDDPANADDPYTLFQNNLLGTPNYMSPEQAMGKPVDSRTDIYSLGAVMYEMLLGRKPFQTDDPDTLLQHIAYKAPTAPHDIDPDIPGVLSRIVMKAMSKRPEKRYQTAEKMALDIKRYLVRARSARNGVQIAVATLDQKEPNVLPEGRVFVWIACIALAAVAAAAAVVGLSRLLR
jgi:serine/threonine-protein kinase